MVGADEMDFPFAVATSVITSTAEEEAREHKLMAFSGGIPTKVIKSCKPSPTGSTMSYSTCSSPYFSDSEEEVVAKKPCLTSLKVDQAVNTDLPMAEPAPVIKIPDNVIRPIPLLPTYTVHLITHDQDDQADKSAPDHPVPITEEAPGIPVKLDNIQLPNVRTIIDVHDQQVRRHRYRKYITDEQYRIVWHATPADENADQVKFTVPFTVDKSNFIIKGSFATVPAGLWSRTLESVLQRAETLEDLRKTISEKVPMRTSRPAYMTASRRHQNDIRIRSTRDHAHEYCIAESY
ncbi:hypothetical protein CRE_14816 [Caenorhabditis remanei]|uniref:Uncharacterized protein n=1 Tax=Caenorhabditis remanei TaxID=31234 RepID=E3MRV3_CAERE|nr:hypothetical protein CRE_14816 [Caenorhabditis remanei]